MGNRLHMTLSKMSSKCSQGNISVLLPYAETKNEWCHLVNKQNTFVTRLFPTIPSHLQEQKPGIS